MINSVDVQQLNEQPTNLIRNHCQHIRDEMQEKMLSPAHDNPIKTENTSAAKRVKVDFSIDAILSRTQPSSSSNPVHSEPSDPTEDPKDDPQFSWVYCTRYRPPKLPRVKREVNVRARYRNPRIPFSTVEVTTLETKFVQSPYLGTNDVNELAVILNMSPKRVKIWFQNRRARERREREIQ